VVTQLSTGADIDLLVANLDADGTLGREPAEHEMGGARRLPTRSRPTYRSDGCDTT
jgi:hypothetical protein